MSKKSLDDLVLKEGTEFKEEDVKYADKEKIQESIKNSFAYDDNTPIPGEDVDYRINEQINSINKNTAMQDLLVKSAMVKAKKEAEEAKQEHKLTAAEKAAQRKQFVDSMLYQQGEMYFQSHHYIMDGKTKRATRKRIERAYDTGKFNKLGLYFDQPKMKTVIRKPKKSENKEPVNIGDMLKM